MKKKYLFIWLAGICIGADAFAQERLYRFADEDFVYKTIIDFFEDPVSAYTEYHNRFANHYFGGVSMADIWAVCVAGGLDIEHQEGRDRCNTFLNTLVQSNYKYFAVCKDAGISKGVEHCVVTFDDISVQYAQAKNLAIEYAKEKMNDSITCSSVTRTENWTYPNQTFIETREFLQCTSTQQSGVYYEFRFQTVHESGVGDNKYVWREFARGMCSLYGGTPERVATKNMFAIEDLNGKKEANLKCKNISSCDWLNQKIGHFGYTVASEGGACLISHDLSGTKTSDRGFSKDYYAKFDGNSFTVFYKNQPFKTYKAVAGRGKTPTDEHPTICQNPEYQACDNVGPTPAGRYFINQNDIQYLDNYGSGTYDAWYKLGNKDAQLSSYGPSRVLLNPHTGTKVYGRNRLYIHGGRFAGSAGCIDLIENSKEFIDWFADQTEFSSMNIVVDYGPHVVICQNCESNATECQPCRCIKSSEVAEKCVYK